MNDSKRTIEGDRYPQSSKRSPSVDFSAWLIVVVAFWLATSVWLVMVKVELTELQETADILHQNVVQLMDEKNP